MSPGALVLLKEVNIAEMECDHFWVAGGLVSDWICEHCGKREDIPVEGGKFMIPEDEKRRVQADGYILCHQCGHRVDDHDEDGCHLTVLCDCDLEYTYDEVSLLYRHYELFPYSLGAQVRYYDSPGDTGTVVGVGLKSDTDITVDVQWDADRETQIIWDPRRELMPVERP